MSDFSGLDLSGDKQLKALFQKLPGRVQKNTLRKGLRAGMKPVAQSIRAAAEKGPIRSSLGRKSKTYGRDGVVALFYGTRGGARTEDGELVANVVHDREYGTSKQAPKPFIRPAFSGSVKQAESMAAEAIARSVEEEAERLGNGATKA